MSKNLKRLFPFLVALVYAVFPVLVLYSYNAEEVSFRVVLFPLLVAILAAFLVFSIWYLILRNPYKASLQTILLIVIAGFYGIFNASLSNHFPVNHLHLFVIFGLLYAGWIILVIRLKKENSINLNFIFGLPVILLVLMNLIRIIPVELKKHRIAKESSRTVLNSESINGEGKGFPDIYVLVFDEYASFPSINEVWGYDNKDFYHFLNDKGFFIAEDSRSRFRTSAASLASLMNLEYVPNGLSMPEILQIYDNNFTMTFLHSLGYNITFIDGYGSYSWSGRIEEVNLMCMYNMGIEERSTIDPFYVLLVNQTILAPWAEKFKDKNPNLYYQVNKYFFDFIERFPFEVNQMDKPSLLYAHIMSPHLPYVFDQDGNFLENPTNHWEYLSIDNETKKELYLEQFKYVTKRMKGIVESILQKSEVAPIILLLSDHGVREESTGSTDPDHIYRVLNAVYFPDGNYTGLHSETAPLNTMRLMFNNLFGKKYDMLPDH